jgi:hypothetical protein
MCSCKNEHTSQIFKTLPGTNMATSRMPKYITVLILCSNFFLCDEEVLQQIFYNSLPVSFVAVKIANYNHRTFNCPELWGDACAPTLFFTNITPMISPSIYAPRHVAPTQVHGYKFVRVWFGLLYTWLFPPQTASH